MLKQTINKATNISYLKHAFYSLLIEDRRLKFYDLSKVAPNDRQSKSEIINLYDSVDNIGNYTPTLGMQKMLSQDFDTWCILDKNIDFDFINQNYKAVIIGGAGIIGIGFRQFWYDFLHKCKLPAIIWGIGSGDKAGTRDLSPDILSHMENVKQVANRCDLVNVRDNLTAEFYELNNSCVSGCPTVVYIQDYKRVQDNNFQAYLYSHHDVFSSQDKEKIITAIKEKTANNYKVTDNIQYSYLGLNKIIEDYYSKSKCVVTTRLHGAIIAYSLGIPYIAITKGAKLTSFQKEYGNGILLDYRNLNQLNEVLNGKIEIKPIKLEPILNFGSKVKQWLSFVT